MTLKRFFQLFTRTTALASIPFLAVAQGPDATQVNSILKNVLSLLTVVVQITILCAFIAFGWGVIKLITAGGDAKRLGDAKKIVAWGVVGIFILASLFGIITFIQTYIGITAGGSIKVPTLFPGNTGQ